MTELQTVLVVLTVIVSILLIVVVLIQKSKGGGLASNFAGSNQILGVRRTNNFIEKATWTLAAIVLVLSIASAFCDSKGNTRTVEVNAPAVQEQAADFNTQAAELPVATPATEEE